MKKVCNVVSNFIVIILVCLSIKAIIEKRNPPITGDGIQYFSKNLIREIQVHDYSQPFALILNRRT